MFVRYLTVEFLILIPNVRKLVIFHLLRMRTSANRNFSRYLNVVFAI